MKETFKKIKQTIISGVILFLPVFILVSLFQKIYGFVYGLGHKVTGILGLDNASGWVTVLTAVILFAIVFVFGLIARLTSVTRTKEWFENNFLNYVPNYSKYNAKMTTKLQPGEDLRQPALVGMSDIWKPGFLISSENGKSTVFMPSTPDTDYGEVWVVETNSIKEINMSAKEFKKSLHLSGKGLKIK